MKRLSIREARTQLTQIDKLLQKNREITLTRRGKPVAKIVAVTGVAEARVFSTADLRAGAPFQEVPSEVLIREDRDARGY